MCVNIPEFGPEVNRDYLGSLLSQATNQEDDEELSKQMFEDDSVLSKLEHDYFHSIIHEIAESVEARHKDDLIEAWAAIDKQATTAEKKNLRSLYVSRYATTDPKEDFCECCAVYFLAGDTFRGLAERSNQDSSDGAENFAAILSALFQDWDKKKWCGNGF